MQPSVETTPERDRRTEEQLRARVDGLTAREVEIARLLTYGLTDAAIAAHLAISVRTASKHVENLRLKLGVRSRWQVSEWAVSQGLRLKTGPHLKPRRERIPRPKMVNATKK